MNDSTEIEFIDIVEANRRHDQQHGPPYEWASVRTSWRGTTVRGKPLTDQRINKYSEQGYYSEDFRTARRELREKRSKKRIVREGNFDVREGRMIYHPS